MSLILVTYYAAIPLKELTRAGLITSRQDRPRASSWRGTARRRKARVSLESFSVPHCRRPALVFHAHSCRVVRCCWFVSVE